jgi:hypothetical protein
VTLQVQMAWLKLAEVQAGSGHTANSARIGIAHSSLSWILPQWLTAIALSLISRPLHYVCIHSLDAGIVPDHFKISVVKPLHKIGDKTSMANCRPVL